MKTEEIVSYLSNKFPGFNKMKRERKSKFPSWFEWNYTEWYAGVTIADVEVDGMLDEVVYVDPGIDRDYVLDECVVRVYRGLQDYEVKQLFVSLEGRLVLHYYHVVTNKEDDRIVCVFVQKV